MKWQPSAARKRKRFPILLANWDGTMVHTLACVAGVWFIQTAQK